MKKTNLRRVFIFLSLTFSLSWGFDWLFIYFSGSDPYLDLGMNPWGMLVPAFVALFLQMYFFKDSPIYHKTYKEKPRWLFYGFFALTIVYGGILFTAAFSSGSKQIFQGIGALLFTLWTLLIFFIYGQSKKGSFERAGLSMGRIKIGVRFIVGIILFFLLQAVLNLTFNLGDCIGQNEKIFNLPIPSNLYVPALIILFILVAVIGVPLSSLAGVFGEEYGWRGFLQSELIKKGKLTGVILVGIIWGVWHFPIILRGVHTYPPSLLGLFLGVTFFTLWGIIQGYAVIKTGSIWVAAFMHGVVNSVYSFSLTYIVKPESKVYSFGLGIYGLIFLGIIVGFILMDPIWKSKRVREN